MMLNSGHLEDLRRYELHLILPLIPKRERILEIGAGSGWQAKLLAEHGHEIEVLDISNNKHSKKQVWAVKEYDGEHISIVRQVKHLR